MRMDKPIVDISNWAVVEGVAHCAYGELAPGRRLTGYVLGHDDLPNGLIFTSLVVKVDHDAGLVQTMNHVYRLGRISDDYAHWLQRRNGKAA
jgi:hypothetical protein